MHKDVRSFNVFSTGKFSLEATSLQKVDGFYVNKNVDKYENVQICIYACHLG